MKKTILSTLFLLLLILSSCSSDSGSVKIISLNTFGNKVCLNDRVKVFVSSQVDDVSAAKYTWGCSGGAMTNPAGLFENIWQAPDSAGTYEIWVTVESNGATETRKAVMTVLDEYFYSNFETPYYNEGYSTSSMTLAQVAADGSMSLTATADNGRWLKSWGDTTLYTPFSMQLKYMVKTIKSGNYVKFRQVFKKVTGANKYAMQLDFVTYPLTGVWNVTLDTYDLSLGTTTTQTLATGTNLALLRASAYTYLSMSIDTNQNLIVFCNGTQLCNINNLKTLADANGFKYNIASSGISLTKAVVVNVDDYFVFTNGTFCNGTARTR